MPRPKKTPVEKETIDEIIEESDKDVETEDSETVVNVIHKLSENIDKLQKFESLVVAARKDIQEIMTDELHDALEDVLMQLDLQERDLLLQQHQILKEIL